MAPQEIYILICRTCNNVTSQGTTDFADMLKDLELVRLSWIIQVVPVESIRSSKSERFSAVVRGRHNVAALEDGAMGSPAKESMWPTESRRGQGLYSPLHLPKEYSLPTP